MTFLELSIISVFCFVQSIFGIGLLLLGTPTFLLLGYGYFDVLNILLPFSILISLSQIISYREKNFKFASKIFIFSVPTLVLGLILVKFLESRINFTSFVSVFLIAFSIINFLKLKKKSFKIRNINIGLVILGIVHGLTNLGGSLLSLIASNSTTEKNIIRFHIANGYLIFATIQIFIINFFFKKLELSYLKFVWVPLIIFFISQYLFKKIENILYYKMLNLFALFYGFYILINTIK